MKAKTLFGAFAALMLVTACGGRKSSDKDIITTDYVAPKPTKPIAMNGDVQNQQVEWVEGRTYQVSVSRTAADSLAMVTDELGQKYIDNMITVEVKRADESVFFHRSFTKQSFSAWLDSDYQKKAILQGIRFHGVEDNALVFVAWVNYPTSGDDEAVELRVAVDRLGDIAIKPFSEDEREDLQLQDEED